jgi:heat shock protein 1/8
MAGAGEAAKDQGNELFKAGDYDGAIKSFTEAINAEPSNEAYYSNRSAAYLKARKFEDAIADGKKCVELKPEWAKGYSRQGAALHMKGDYALAVAIYAQGLAQDADDAVLVKGLTTSQTALAGNSKNKKKKDKKKAKTDDKAGDPDDEDTAADYIIGIDLGTTYSCVGVWKDDKVTIIENEDGERTIPSYVCIDPKTGSRTVGQSAKNQTTRLPRNTIYDAKRIIGQRMSDHGVEKDISRMPFNVMDDGDNKPIIEVTVQNEEGQDETRRFAPEEISAAVLGKCKSIAEKHLGCLVNKAVITVPAYFNDAQRNATKTAGQIAGLQVMRIINEPTAASLSYGLDNKTKEGKALNILIFDLGGGTFDVSILSIDGGVFTVKATGGDTRLGGEDFDSATIAYLMEEAEKKNGIKGIEDQPREYQRLRKAAEAAKRQLSTAQTADISLDAFCGNKAFTTKLTRDKFNQLQKGPFGVTIDTVKHVLKDAKLKTDDIDEIVLVGGSTRIPKIQEMLSALFNGKALCKTLNPDEAVAYGAAVQGAILNGKRNSKTDSLLLMDVTPLSLGIETTGRVMSVIIPRNTPIPCVKTQVYTTEQNFQTQVDISVYEGERLKSDENNLLGEFTINGIESAKKGEPQINVTFAIDSNGILEVTAKDQKTNAVANISIANRSKCSTEDIDRMVADAAKYKAADEERLRKVEAKNELESTIFEVMEAANASDDGKMAAILKTAAEKEEVWLETNYESVKSSEINLHRRQLSRRLGSKAV